MKTTLVVPFSNQVHLFIHLSTSLTLYARIPSEKTQQLMDLCTVQHSTEQALMF